jgi:hypothetical protein
MHTFHSPIEQHGTQLVQQQWRLASVATARQCLRANGDQVSPPDTP